MTAVKKTDWTTEGIDSRYPTWQLKYMKSKISSKTIPSSRRLLIAWIEARKRSAPLGYRFSTRALAEAFGITRQVLLYWTKGLRSPTPENAATIDSLTGGEVPADCWT